MTTRRDNEEISGGRFVNPGVLPPTRTTRLQGGRFVQPMADIILPPERQVVIDQISMVPGADKPFHFGQMSGGIAALGGVGITKVMIKQLTPGSWQKIWENGVTITPAPTIPVGTNWELGVAYIASSTVALWAACITVVASPIPTGGDGGWTGDGKDSKNDRFDFSGSVTKDPEGGIGLGPQWNMGPMPNSNVTLRIKCWVTDYYTLDPPPDAPPTQW